ncbi:hypothetical protein IC615_06195 [Serratia ureilytica]
MTLLLSGSFFDGDTRYTIERAMIMDYQRQGSNYTLRRKEAVRKPQDNLIMKRLTAVCPCRRR